jgi:hypothetical protein
MIFSYVKMGANFIDRFLDPINLRLKVNRHIGDLLDLHGDVGRGRFQQVAEYLLHGTKLQHAFKVHDFTPYPAKL